MKNVFYLIPMFKKYETIRIPILHLNLLLLGFFPLSGWAQSQMDSLQNPQNSQKGSIQGFVKDALGKPIPGASLTLRKSTDTGRYVKNITGGSTQSDDKGAFTLRVSEGNYSLTASFIGLNNLEVPGIIVKGDQTLKIPDLILSEKSIGLKGVNVIAKKPFIERKVDKTVLNVEADILATGENALEVLKKAPGVTLDKDDHISLQGKQGVTIMLDGKLTYLSIDALTNLLKNMPASSIETIEIITQPSAKYDASGNSGIINIKTKKLKKAGLNGIITSGLAHGVYYRLNESINLNYKTGNWNIFANYDYSWNRNQNHLLLNRYFNTPGELATFNSDTYIMNNFQNHNYKGGIDYSISKTQTIGIQLNGYAYHGTNPTNNHTSILNANNLIDSTLLAVSSNYFAGNGITYNLNYKNTLDTLGQELLANFDYSLYNNQSSTTLTNTFFQPKQIQSSSSNSIQTSSPSHGDIRVGKLDYTLPFNKTSKLDFGGKYSWVKTDNNINYDSLRNKTYVPALTQSNHFVYTEQVAALYGSFNKQWKKTGLVLGLRLEDTHSDGNSITLNNEVKRSYLDFFPNLSISQKLDSNNQFGFNYSRRIDRPSYQDLNPFRFYLDQYTFQEGNPFLRPQYTESFEVSDTYKNTTFVSFNFSWIKDVATQIILQNDTTKVSKVTSENLANQYNFSLTFSKPVHPTPWWTINLNLNTNFNKYTSKAGAGLSNVQLSRISGSANITNTLTFPNNWSGEVNAFYNAPAVYGYLMAKSQYAINAGIQKSFWNKKANLKLSVDDIFKMNKFRGSQVESNVDIQIVNYFDSRRASLSFTYGFGTNPQKHSKSTASEEEQNRNKH